MKYENFLLDLALFIDLWEYLNLPGIVDSISSTITITIATTFKYKLKKLNLLYF